ncbi:MAG: hypothetical protein HY790_08495 [Deltaproteobacteria bacterium]|nr:hypothetical protein [Deltaproteobacteria bacterium]
MTPRAWQILACIVLVLATVAAFGEVRHHQFIQFDDVYYLTENPAVQEGLTPKGIIWAFTTTRTGNWTPLTWLSHLLDCQIFGLRPGGHHLTNLLFHLANTLLLFLWLQRATRALGPAFLVAALFAWHPLHVEPVAWVAARKDVLSTFFWLLTMWAYLWYGERPGRGRYFLVVLCFTLGLMAKPMLVTLPFVLLLLDYWPLGRWASGGGSARSLILEKLPLLALAAVFSIVTLYAQQEVGAVAPLGEIPFSSRVATALAAYVWYPLKMFWPAGSSWRSSPSWSFGGPGVIPISWWAGSGIWEPWRRSSAWCRWETRPGRIGTLTCPLSGCSSW